MHTDCIPDPYMALFPHLLLPVLWERPGNIPPLVRLLQAFIEKGANQIEADKVVSLQSYCMWKVILHHHFLFVIPITCHTQFLSEHFSFKLTIWKPTSIIQLCSRTVYIYKLRHFFSLHLNKDLLVVLQSHNNLICSLIL